MLAVAETKELWRMGMDFKRRTGRITRKDKVHILAEVILEEQLLTFERVEF